MQLANKRIPFLAEISNKMVYQTIWVLAQFTVQTMQWDYQPFHYVATVPLLHR